MRPTKTILAAVALMVPAVTLAAESGLTGNMQVQGSYGAPEDGGDDRWSLRTPHSWLGVEVVESLQSSRYLGVWEFDIDPLAEEPGGSTRRMFIEWQQALYQIRAGRLATLERRHLSEPVSIMNGVGDAGTFSGRNTQSYLDRSLQLDASNGELAFLSAEWQISAPDQDKTIEQWALASGLDTPEGKAALLYRNDEQDRGLWGFNAVWQQGPWTLGGTYLYRDEPLAWDLLAQYGTGALVSKLSYGRDEVADESHWSLGFDQRFSQAVRAYSELRWERSPDTWLWQTGFRLRF